MLLWLLYPVHLLAQESRPVPTPAIDGPKVPLPSPSPVTQAPSEGQGLVTPSEARPLYGVQGVLVETLNGRIVATQNEDQSFNPASAIKLATALVALRTFGKKHRFSTGIWTDGNFDKSNNTLIGNLYISGRDPSLHYEHAIEIAHQLNTLGIRTVTGDLIVSPDFTLNFSWSARRSGDAFYDTLDLQLRSTDATRAWLNARNALGNNMITGGVPSVAVMGEVLVGPVAAGAKLLLTHNSSPLSDILKVLLCYSNNFMAERLGESLGGVQSVRRQLVSLLGIPDDQIALTSMSGLGVNRVSPQVMMKVLRALRQEASRNGLLLSDLLPVAGIDPGTLEDRFVTVPWRGSVIAKTGTLIRTDGGASSLVGQLRTVSGEVLLFVIMNQNGNVSRFRNNQDFLVMQIQNTRGGPRSFDYVPQTLAIKLVNTKSTLGSSDEYEPKVTVTSSP
jgi:D-alanyl-D-alanine carboxypeptidase/D-alanyl-D-alanine-endopeptidase (penicillin-binding protein 4)